MLQDLLNEVWDTTSERPHRKKTKLTQKYQNLLWTLSIYENPIYNQGIFIYFALR
jgi:hypothetical protein